MAQEQHTQERRSEWSFVITDKGWIWSVTRPNGAEERSSGAYETLKEAGDDAMAHGYGAWKHAERRELDH